MTSTPLLSICIATFKRAAFIEETLDSILAQLEAGVELLVVDGASPDDTEAVMRRYAQRHPEVRYFRQTENGGVDGDYDNAVQYARGRYCWLMTDDDLVKPGAIRRVLDALADSPQLVVVNAEVRSLDFSILLAERMHKIENDRSYSPSETAKFFLDTAKYLSFIGAVIIERTVWLARNRSRYYGSLFVHVGVIFQEASIGQVKVLAEPALVIRFGNAMWKPHSFEIWMKKWPDLIWSFPHFSDAAKRRIVAREPFRNPKKLVLYRAGGGYSMAVFESALSGRLTGWRALVARAIAWSPVPINNSLMAAYCLSKHPATRMGLYELKLSPAATRFTRGVARWLQL